MSGGEASARGLGRRPTFAATIVLLLALGGGATAAVFSIVQSVLLRPLPYPNPRTLVSFSSTIAPEDLEYLTTRVPGLDAVAGINPGWMMALVDDQGPVKVTVDKGANERWFSRFSGFSGFGGSSSGVLGVLGSRGSGFSRFGFATFGLAEFQVPGSVRTARPNRENRTSRTRTSRTRTSRTPRTQNPENRRTRTPRTPRTARTSRTPICV